ncbi:amidohydrolase [Novosphingobium sp. AAP1]|uniref:amidohydrolase family protein n=1 Tax=Novosphingobium sp. AAP1 TaxID=1523413 RepID=UPI0006B89C48|nr:amidohydrolase family protein [Novosphingobium sp. AAP1]KPF56484.1 amidohydrolase [Novosphingobium sp. AAP1]
MQAVDTLVTGAMLVTMDAQRRVIRDGAVAMAQGRIVAVGPSAEVAAMVAPREVIDARGFVATPGFVNAHVHLTETLIRNFLPEALPFDEGLNQWVIPLYQGHSAQEQAIAARLAVLAMLKTGTTTFLEAGTLIAFEAVAEALEGTGIRGRIGRWCMDRAFAPGEDQAALTQAALDAFGADLAAWPDDGRLIAAWPLLVGHMTNTAELWQAATAIARARGLRISAHMAPAAGDPEWYLANTGKRPVEWLADLGVLGDHLSLVHMVHVDEREVALLAQSGTHVVHCPEASLKGGYQATTRGLFPEMAAAGVTIAIGTDGGDRHDLMPSARLMAGLWKDARGDTALFPAESALEMLTVNGARAMGLEGQVGTLAVGARADLVLHDTRRPEWMPLHNPVQQLVWSADGRGVHSVWVDGRRVVDAGRCTTIDEEQLLAQAQDAAQALVSRSGLPLRMAWPIL